MADKNKPAITADQFSVWLTPPSAVKELHHLEPSSGRITLIQALQYGQIRAAAKTAVVTIRGRNNEIDFLSIPTDWWRNLGAGALFWSNGQIIFSSLTISNSYDCVAALFDVRFDPEQVRSLLPPSLSFPVHPKMIQVETAEESKKDAPPVSAVLLNEWYVLYCKTCSEADDTEERALKSARGMFPDKLVSRERVRNLRGARQRGRKPKPSEQ
jgi:hypothetical protein